MAFLTARSALSDLVCSVTPGAWAQLLKVSSQLIGCSVPWYQNIGSIGTRMPCWGWTVNRPAVPGIRGFQFKPVTRRVKLYERIHGLGCTWATAFERQGAAILGAPARSAVPPSKES